MNVEEVNKDVLEKVAAKLTIVKSVRADICAACPEALL